jgi:hypothetical protein
LNSQTIHNSNLLGCQNLQPKDSEEVSDEFSQVIKFDTKEINKFLKVQANSKIKTLNSLSPDSAVAFRSSQEQELQKQITIKISGFESLVNSAKEKLKSKSYFSTDREERDRQLESFFEIFPTNLDEFIKGLESIKKDLSKKLIWSEINSLCQTKVELNSLQKELESLRQDQAQILQLPPPSSFK